jgi:uncharacterized protein with PIN domain
VRPVSEGKTKIRAFFGMREKEDEWTKVRMCPICGIELTKENRAKIQQEVGLDEWEDWWVCEGCRRDVEIDQWHFEHQ